MLPTTTFREISKLMEVNSRIVGSLMGSIGQVGMPSAAEMPTSPEVRLGPETRFQPTARSSPARSTAKAED